MPAKASKTKRQKAQKPAQPPKLTPGEELDRDLAAIVNNPTASIRARRWAAGLLSSSPRIPVEARRPLVEMARAHRAIGEWTGLAGKAGAAAAVFDQPTRTQESIV